MNTNQAPVQSGPNGPSGGDPSGGSIPTVQTPGPWRYQPPTSWNQYLQGSWSNTKFTSKLDSKDGLKLGETQAFWQGSVGILAGLGAILDAGASWQLTNKYMENVTKGYDAQIAISSDYRAVAEKEMDTKYQMTLVSKDMHQNQLRHEEKIAEITRDTHATLARIQENGRIERTRIVASAKPFDMREDQFYG
ncbi:MAG: hypothetical protein A3I05_04485 [Deltaproteobacteria bacterium RIFCSPLOWO2_02_FULL_44_10]|nr:MAG: hypothetical protein A3C46_07290 [Deltaproteobacteria bacterium RIFCSPHIGHO2_02_FULL_44_16]OGQ46615.1 MAG: hypothetical protein A3I05_04485 [Deltaproteobacteria bacterium RIFCSPLOWO2_02_FULL_44_10]